MASAHEASFRDAIRNQGFQRQQLSIVSPEFRPLGSQGVRRQGRNYDLAQYLISRSCRALADTQCSLVG
jgi:hypothetical protein